MVLVKGDGALHGHRSLGVPPINSCNLRVGW
jgi:hypothetical protein